MQVQNLANAKKGKILDGSSEVPGGAKALFQAGFGL